MSSAHSPAREVAGVEILSKAMALCFALEGGGELSAQQLADRAGEPASSTFRLLSQLIQLGWIERGVTRGTYRLGLMFLTIGGQIEDSIDIRDAAKPPLESLSRSTGVASFLSVRRGDGAVCIERFEAPDVRSHATRIGDSLPLHAGAASLAILAFLPLSEGAAYLASIAPGIGDVELRRVREDIAQTRTRGFSLSDGHITPGMAAVGAPIYNHRGELEGAISVSGLRVRVVTDVARTGSLVQQAARATNARLGAEVNR